MRIVVYRVGGLGDTLLTFPAVRAVRRRYPQAFIEAVGNAARWSPAGSLVDHITSSEHPAVAGLSAASPPAVTRAWLEEVDLLLAWSVSPLAPRPALHQTSPFPPPGIHAADWYRTLLDLPPAPLARPPASAHGPVLVHPGAGAEWKRWPAACFARVIEGLQHQGLPVRLIQGEADAAAVSEVQHHLHYPVPVLAGRTPVQLLAELTQARLYIGNDSGVSHLAALAGTRALVLFGPTDPANWAPRGRVTVLRACHRRAVYQGQIRVCHDPACLERITPQAVLQAAVDNPC